MSLEKAIKKLTNEINQLNLLLKVNNELLIKNQTIVKVEPNLKANRILTESEAAKYIGMSRSFLSQDRMNGQRENRTKGPKVTKIGRSVRYSSNELDSWLIANMK